MKVSPLIVVFAASLVISGCGTDRAVVERTLAPVVPASSPGLSTDIVLSVNPGTDAPSLWSDYDLIQQDVMPDGRTYRVRSTGGLDPAPVMTQILEDNRVAAAELNLPVLGPILRQSSVAFNEGFPTAGEFFDQPLAQRLGLASAHAGSRGHGVKIAILDTGIDLDHPLLSTRIHPESRDFLDNDSDASDVPDGTDNDNDGFIDEATGHGTHVAGLVVLVAPSARILALRVLDSDGNGNVYAVAAAIEYAVSKGVRIINMSIGLTAPSAIVEQAINAAHASGVILITAAGNNPNGPFDYPATSSKVWAIAAVDAGNQPASFTSAFPAVVLSAPGVNLKSTYWNGGYSTWSGTSMAAPLVSGTAALILSRNSQMSMEAVLNILKNTAKPYKTTTYGMGAGVLDPGSAIGAPQAYPFPGREHSRY